MLETKYMAYKCFLFLYLRLGISYKMQNDMVYSYFNIYVKEFHSYNQIIWDLDECKLIKSDTCVIYIFLIFMNEVYNRSII